MNKHTLLGALLCLATASIGAQVAQYSYISDRRFTSPDQLMGYDFKPAMREVPGEEPTEIKVGSYSFGITRKNLYVEGADIRGVYNLNEINSTEYGYILRTMNARDPTIQGHLKIVVDEIGQVEGLIFKRSNNDKEVIYFLRMIPPEVAEAERLYFTHKGALKVSHLDSLWTGIEVRPFLRIFNNMGGIQQRVLPADSVSLRFYHVTTIEEKENMLATFSKSRRKRGRGDDQTPSAGEAIDETQITASATAMPLTPATAFAKTSPAFAKTPTAATPATAASTPAAGAQSTGIVPLGEGLARVGPDSLALAALDSLGADALAQVGEAPPAAGATDSTDVKLKITTKFYVDLNSFMRYDNGTSEMQHRTYLVNGALETHQSQLPPGRGSLPVGTQSRQGAHGLRVPRRELQRELCRDRRAEILYAGASRGGLRVRAVRWAVGAEGAGCSLGCWC